MSSEDHSGFLVRNSRRFLRSQKPPSSASCWRRWRRCFYPSGEPQSCRFFKGFFKWKFQGWPISPFCFNFHKNMSFCIFGFSVLTLDLGIQVRAAIESGFWTFVDMASGRYLWRNMVSSSAKRSSWAMMCFLWLYVTLILNHYLCRPIWVIGWSLPLML